MVFTCGGGGGLLARRRPKLLQLSRNIISPRLGIFLFIPSHQRLTVLLKLYCVYHVLLSTTEILYLWTDRNFKETGALKKKTFPTKEEIMRS